jgi:ABC-2 type transport system ATP-binding protein
MPGNALTIEDLAKTVRPGPWSPERKILQGVTLGVERGEVFGYLGPNGSGKTTTLKIVLGLVAPDAGRIAILGRPQGEPGWRHQVGFLPEHPYFYDYLTASEYLDYVGRLFGLTRSVRRARARELLGRVGLARSADVSLRRYSKGMLQRMGLAQALINEPELVFLDEPMSGLDPLGRRMVRELILELKRAGKTVFFSTHILSDAEALCERVALLRGGRVVRAGRLDEILPIDVLHFEVLVAGLSDEARGRLTTPLRSCQIMGERCRLEADEALLGALLRELSATSARILAVQPVRKSLEDYFVEEMARDEKGGTWSLDD